MRQASYKTVLMNEEVRASLPPLYAGEEKGMEALVVVKYFAPWSDWTWYATEFDGKDLFFGLVAGFELELGYFSLSELEQAVGPAPLNFPIERDLYFRPNTLGYFMDMHKRQRQRSE